MSVDAAAGDFIVQWDDDDWYHPRRVELQMAARPLLFSFSGLFSLLVSSVDVDN